MHIFGLWEQKAQPAIGYMIRMPRPANSGLQPELYHKLLSRSRTNPIAIRYRAGVVFQFMISNNFTTLAPVMENPEGYFYSNARNHSDMNVLMDIDFL